MKYGKRYEVYIYNGDHCFLRYSTDDIDEACDKAHEIEQTSEEKFEGTIIYDCKEELWFGKHKRYTAYVLSK